MSRRVVIYPHRMASSGSRSLRDALQETGLRCFRVFPDRNYIPRYTDMVVGWGSSTYPDWGVPATMLNNMSSVAGAVDKRASFCIMQRAGVPVPLHCQSAGALEFARTLVDGGGVAYARTLTRASGGRGIIVMHEGRSYTEEEEIVISQCPLFVAGVAVEREYRIHIGKLDDSYSVLATQQKRKRRGVEHNMQVRNLEGGWVYCVNDIIEPQSATLTAAAAAVHAHGLDFGAVDVVESVDGESYVLEVNTAPGLESPTVIQGYVNYFRSRYDD